MEEDSNDVQILNDVGVSIQLPNRFYKSEWTKRLDEARKKNEYCDMVLVAGSQATDDIFTESDAVYAHKIILKLASSYFSKILASAEPNKKDFIVNDIDRSILDILISCIYTCHLDNVSKDNMFALLAGAKLLDLEDAQSACEKFINKHRKVKNCARILDFGRIHGYPSLSNPKFVLDNLLQVAQTEEFPHLPIETLQLLVSSPDRPKYCSVSDLLSSLLLWVNAGGGGGGSRMEEFLSLVKQLPRQELDDETMECVFLEDPIVSQDNACQKFFHEYLVEFFREHKKSSQKSNGNAEKQKKKRYSDQDILAETIKVEPDEDENGTGFSDSFFEEPRKNKRGGRALRTRRGDNVTPLPGPKSRRRPIEDSEKKNQNGQSKRRRHDSGHSSNSSQSVEDSAGDPKSKINSLPTTVEPPFGDPNKSCILYFIAGEKNNWNIMSFDLQTGDSKMEASCLKRTNCGVVYHNKSIYIIGGITYAVGIEVESCETLVFDLTDPSTWRQDVSIPEMYKPRYDFQCLTWGNSIYAIGGSRSDMIVNNLLRLSCDDLSKGWEKLPGMRCMKSNSAGAVVDGKIYSIGGLIAEDEDDVGASASGVVECFDIEKGKGWVDVARMPTPRLGLAVAALGSKLYALGGGSTSENLNSKVCTVEVYDTEDDTWATLKPMKKKRQYFSAVAFNGLIFAIGGNSLKAPDMEVYDPTMDEWALVGSSLPLKGDFHSVAFKIIDSPNTETLDGSASD